MLKDKFQDLIGINEMTGLEIFTGQQEPLFHACRLKIRRKELSFEQQTADLKSVVYLAKQYKPGPIALCLTGKGILTKKLDQISVLNQQIINQVFPNTNMDHFYFQVLRRNDYCLLSAVRKKNADDLIDRLFAHGFLVVSLTLGEEVKHEVIEISSDKLKPDLAVAFAVAFQLLVHQEEELICAAHPLLKENRTQILAKEKLKGLSVIIAPVLLLLLLISFLVFAVYTEKLEKLSSQTQITDTEVNRLQMIETGINHKIAFIRSVGWTGGLHYAYLCDQLISSMPQQIRLTGLTINPVDDLQRGEKQQDINLYQIIEVIGICENAAAVNDWFFTLKAKSWVSDCKLISYGINQDNGKGVFTVRIQLKDYEG